MSTSSTCYARPPVAEAIIDLHVAFDEQPSLDCYEACIERLKDTFPIRTPIQSVRVGVLAQEGIDPPSATVEQQQIGYRLSSGASDKILQLQEKTFTLSQLPPYQGWDGFFATAKSAWDVYLKELKPTRVTRVAIRFINRISIPGAKIELDDYFNVGYKIPENINQDVVMFFLQLALPQQDMKNIVCNLNLMQTSPDMPGTVALILDFDLYRVDVFDPKSNEIWDIISTMRDRKNDLFESCITEKTREFFR